MSAQIPSWSSILEHDVPLICGVLNVTPDSFSDGGAFVEPDPTFEHISNMFIEGADLIDVGAESTRPNAQEILSEQECERLRHTFDYVSTSDKLFSIDTRHAQTARIAVENGMHIINDVSGATFDPVMAETISETGALCVLMHMRGTPETMQSKTNYDDVIDDVCRELEERIAHATSRGVLYEKIMLDPGIGFSKTPEQNIELIKNCGKIKSRLGFPMMVGVSRKTVTSYMLTGDTQSASMADRDAATSILSVHFADAGIDVIRVHDVVGSREALNVWEQLKG